MGGNVGSTPACNGSSMGLWPPNKYTEKNSFVCNVAVLDFFFFNFSRSVNISPVLRIRIRMDPHQSEKLDPDPHQSEKVEALEGHFGAL
jgi:hypothetical protein